MAGKDLFLSGLEVIMEKSLILSQMEQIVWSSCPLALQQLLGTIPSSSRIFHGHSALELKGPWAVPESFFPLHLQRVTDTITAAPAEIYPEPLWHFIDFGWGWLRAPVQRVMDEALAAVCQSRALPELWWHLPVSWELGIQTLFMFIFRKLSCIPPPEIYLFFTWIQNKILFFQELWEQPDPVPSVPGVGRI